MKRSFGLCSLQLTYYDEENEEGLYHFDDVCVGQMILKEMKGTKEEDKTPPAWFTSYMEKFKDQVVREAVEKICREFSGQCSTEPPMVPEVSSSALPGVPTSATPSCSACRGQTTGGGYQCSVCTACTLCEPCSFSHDPSHNLVRARTPLSIPEHGSPAPDHSRFYRRGDRSFRKAEKQRLKAEKRLLKAEVKEIRKQLRMERRGIQWSSTHREGCSSPVLLQPRATQRPKRPCPLAVPAMTATFLDENLPDGTRLRPGTKFIKYWKMRNTGSVGWTQDTKLKFMWGNLAVGSGERWREVSVPFLQPGQVGVVSVALCAPPVEGSYTSHWRLAHAGEQFGPRVWCSIVVDPLAPAPVIADGILVSPCVTPQLCAAAAPPLLSVDQEEYCIPSVELLTAQDLLSFELLDINIVQELESVPNIWFRPDSCLSPLPLDCPLQDKGGPTLGLIQEEAEVINTASGATAPGPSGVPAQEEGQEDLSSSQFVCETVIRSMPLEKVPESRPVPEPRPGATEAPGVKDSGECAQYCEESEEPRNQSRSSSTSSEDYIIVLPDCFDTSRPLGDSMYSSALSQPGDVPARTPTDPSADASADSSADQFADPSADPPGPSAVSGAPDRGPSPSSANDMLCTSQTLDQEPLTPEVVAPPMAPSDTGLTSGLVKGALSVAASAYKALFTGQGPPQVSLLNYIGKPSDSCLQCGWRAADHDWRCCRAVEGIL
uniref:Nbr1 FW domain-containing protein n=1 Tax=Periophthalmus magnuspinnatus TaxID=409849 RepID=A0A3B3ZYN8_9GOBI